MTKLRRFKKYSNQVALGQVFFLAPQNADQIVVSRKRFASPLLIPNFHQSEIAAKSKMKFNKKNVCVTCNNYNLLAMVRVMYRCQNILFNIKMFYLTRANVSCTSYEPRLHMRTPYFGGLQWYFLNKCFCGPYHVYIFVATININTNQVLFKQQKSYSLYKICMCIQFFTQ